MQVSVSGHPSLVVDGYAVQNHPDRNLGNASGVLTDGVLCTKRDPRTIVGLNKDQTRLMVVTVDGRGPGRAGMTCAEAADYMVRLGAYTALNLDGGGSTAMWQEGAGILNRPSDGFTRPVANTLNIHAPHHGAAPGQFGGPPADNAPGPYCAVP